ncbi:hypothetical protein SCHPADRAFT_894852 [Schizopora paradoxa]|uniref:Uncharacterized protein n=1 Tax=Schizopora paradoxa TaxID=27342 RepID=A0A0H2R5Y1_9AGAM|nr:hypothetical protein SCHPADRAFT_894852 [Schizopora paradoxa]
MGEIEISSSAFSYTILLKTGQKDTEAQKASLQYMLSKLREALDNYIRNDGTLRKSLRGMKSPYFEISSVDDGGFDDVIYVLTLREGKYGKGPKTYTIRAPAS